MASSPLRRGDVVELSITGITARGRGRAQVDAHTIEVPSAVPGDRVRVRIDALSRWRPVAHASLEAVLESSPDRRPIACDRHTDRTADRAGDGCTGCTGCPLLALELAAQRRAKAEALARDHGLSLPSSDAIVGGDGLGYRWSSKRIVAGRAGALVLGSRRSVSGRRAPSTIADMSDCLVDHPAIVRTFDALKRRADALGIEPWTDEGGDLRYLWAKTDGARVLLTLVTGRQDSRAARELGPAALGLPEVAGVAWTVQGGHGNAIRGRGPVHTLGGATTLRIELAQVPVDVGPLGFLQPNPVVASQAYAKLVEVPPGLGRGLAFDLYAGAGVTTQLLRRRFDTVVPCEAYPESAEALGVPAQTSEAFLAQRGAESPDLVVANPPRGGLGEAVCAALLAVAPRRLHIMSCNPATAADDLRRLAPGFERVGLWAYDTLPQTAHLELVLHLEHKTWTTTSS